MKIYTLTRKQMLPISLEKAWTFFSSPANLKKITPSYMGFEITSDLGDGKMYPGQIISYVVTPLMGLPMRWTTEITHVVENSYFVDEQRFGPYAFWHHQHWFKQVEGGVEMTDIINYGIPFGWIGTLANSLIVKHKLNEIFTFREEIVKTLFG